MAAGTVGYTDTRGNKDYTSIIAKSIGNRLKQASNMASEERAYAAGMAEAGGTSLEEAGIGKGYFFGRALGSRFGGDRIARAKGRMGVGGAGTSPATNYKQRFRGGFDYNVTNNTITDVAPLSNALVVGLRGVEQGLSDVAGSIQRQGTILNKLSQNQADMAKATMFNGYLFAMFQSQQKQKAGRDSLRREEASIEGRGRGRIGGASFGGAGGGRGMINVTGGGSSGSGRSGGSSGAGASFFTSNIASSAARLGSTSLSAGRGMTSIATGAKSAKGYKALASGDIVGMMGSNSLYSKYGIDISESVAKNPDSVAMAAAKMFGLNVKEADSLATVVSGASKGPKYLDDATAAFNHYGKLYTESDPAARKILEHSMLSKQFGKKSDKISNTMMESIKNLHEIKVINKKHAGTFVRQSYMDNLDDVYEKVVKKYGEKNAAKFKTLGLFGHDELMLGMGELRPNAIADSLMKHYPDMTYDGLEKAVLMARVGDMKDAGYGSTRIIKEVRKTMGNNVADELFMKHADDLFTNTGVMKTFAKGSGRVGLRRILKAVPGLGLGLGIIFGIQRAMEGDLVGAGLEIGSGVLGLNPATTGLGLGIDGFLLARDMGVVNMRDRGSIIPGGANVPFAVGGNMFRMNERKSGDERIRVERDDKSRHLDAGLGLIEAMKSKRNDYVKIMGQGVFSGIGDAASGGLFENIGSGLTTITDNIKNMFSNFKDTTGNILNKLNPFKRDENGQNMFQRVGSNVKNWWNKDSSDGGIIDSARFNVQKFINRRILGKKDTKYMQQYNPEEGVSYGSLPSDYKETEAKYFQTGMYTPNVENSGINVAPAVSMGATYITNNNYGVGSGASGGDSGDGNPTIDDLGFQGLVSNFNLASK